MRDSFVFYRSFRDAIKHLPKEEQLMVYNAIADYSLDGETSELEGIAMAVFTLIKPQIDANQKRYENGKKGGRTNQSETKLEPKVNRDETKLEPNVNVNDNVNVNVNVNDNANEKKKKKAMAKEPKIQFAEFVAMTNAEHTALIAKIGEKGANRCIEILDNYKGANGKKYASDYRAILTWVIGRLEEENKKPKKSQGGNPFFEYAKELETGEEIIF